MKYELKIYEVTTEDVPERNYERIGKNAEGNDEYGYVDTGRTKIERKTREIYSQEKENLDVGELAIYINRARNNY